MNLIARELRIGNYIWFNDAPEKIGIAKVTQILDNGILTDQGFAYINEIEPIPLTEEWLLKFGFQKSIGFFMILSKLTSIELGLNNDTAEIQYYCYFRERSHVGEGDYVLLRKNLKYVHQLQNLYFAITGIELTIP